MNAGIGVDGTWIQLATLGAFIAVTGVAGACLVALNRIRSRLDDVITAQKEAADDTIAVLERLHATTDRQLRTMEAAFGVAEQPGTEGDGTVAAFHNPDGYTVH